MPAILPAKLKKDVAELLEKLDDIDLFEHELEHLLEYYADRTVRPSQTGMPASLLPTFHVPRPVLRELTLGLGRFAISEPDAALSLAHRLWIQGIYEPMYLSVQMLDKLSDSYSRVVMRNFKNWMQATEDGDLLVEIFQAAARRDAADVILFLESLIESGVFVLQTTALVGLGVLADYASMETMPGVLKLTGLMMQNADMVRQPKMISLIKKLAERSPAESAFFMRQQYLVSVRPEIARLLRQCLSNFPQDIAKDLQRMLREN